MLLGSVLLDLLQANACFPRFHFRGTQRSKICALAHQHGPWRDSARLLNHRDVLKFVRQQGLTRPEAVSQFGTELDAGCKEREF